MVKKFYVRNTSCNTNATANLFEAESHELLENTSQLPLRIDKVMVQWSGSHACTATAVVGVVISLSDMNGLCFDDSISGDSFTDLTSTLDDWRDFIWSTDFRHMATGTGSSAAPPVAMQLEAATKRILAPGQKLFVSLLVTNKTTEAAKSVIGTLDCIVWYSPAAQ